ncbi:MAG: hypothetical protein L6Q69_03000 [Zoogloea sp.]|nr:hypothetical protein [Zoogloea sp.]
MKLPDRSDLSRLSLARAARLGPLLAWGVALAVTAWVAVDLFWRFTAPRPPALPVATEADPLRAAQAIASRHLLGKGAAPGTPAAVAAAPGRYTVQAVVTGAAGRPGWAVIAIDGGPQQGFVEGQEIRPGVTLARVAGDGVELALGGARQRVALADRGTPGTPGDPAMPPAQPLPDQSPPVVTLPSARMHTEVNAVDASQQPPQAGFPSNLQAQPFPSPHNQ